MTGQKHSLWLFLAPCILLDHSGLCLMKLFVYLTFSVFDYSMNPYDEPRECCADHSRHIGKQGRQYICWQDNKIDNQKAVNSHESVFCDLYVQQGTFLYAYWYSIWHIVSILCWLLSERNVECFIFLLHLHWSSELPHCVTATNISMRIEKTNGKTGGERWRKRSSQDYVFKEKHLE